MPVTGGAADKLGNRYEALWAIDQLLRIIEGAASELTLEPLDPDQSRGIEFRVVNSDGTIEYWSVKRQTTKAAGWTLAALAAKNDHGRSILGDLQNHVEQDQDCRSVFASMLGAPIFDELLAYAADKKMLDDRLNRSEDLNRDFINHVLPLCGGDAEKARVFLLRTKTHNADEAQLRERVGFAIRMLLYTANGSPVDTAAVRGFLGDLLLDNIHRPLRQDTILNALERHGIRRRDWAIDKAVTDQIDAICESYSAPLDSQLINETFLHVPGADDILGAGNRPVKSKVLVIGGAGGGKSCALSAAVGKLRRASIPVLPIRIDQLPEGILTTTELGRKLGLPVSPTLVLAGVARGGPCALVIDQLDAVSIASGRRTEVWSLFDALRREAERHTGLCLLVGCRAFDIEHDHRMRGLKAEGSGFELVELKPLPPDQVDEVLRGAGIAPKAIPATLRPVLAVPLHLSMYLGLPAPARLGVHSRDELFDRFWTEKERRTDQRMGRKAAWTAVIDKLANWLSANQQLSAPQVVLDDYSADAAAMTSEHVLVLVDKRYRFFHESFFDYVFARRFVASGDRLVDMLLGGEQHLFRRAQVRQILAYLRVQDWQRYLSELEIVLTANLVRFHIKSLVLKWMSSLPDPRPEEWEVLQRLLGARPGIRSHVRGVMTGNEVWFDVLDASGFFEEALKSGDSEREQEAVWLFALPSTLATRSSRVAALLKQHRKPGDLWNQYLRHVCRHGGVYHSREMFDLFLSLIDDGTLDGLRPGFTVNDDWWDVLYEMADKQPEFACEAIGRWFDRALVTWKETMDKAVADSQTARPELHLWQHLDRARNGSHVILDAAKSALSFAEHMLPRVARFVSDTAADHLDCLQLDPLWSFRYYKDDPIQIHSALLCGLARSLETLAHTNPLELDRLLMPYKDRPHDTVAYLVLRAWSAAPDIYADQLADYLVTDPRRLKVGYASWGGRGGSAENYVSSQAIKAASSTCTGGRLAALETVIINLTDEWELKHPQIRGRRQLELLESIVPSRLSAAGNSKLRELRAKFPTIDRTQPKPMEVVRVGSPISENAQAKMSDEHWLRAMRKYAGVEQRDDRPIEFSGGERQLAQSLEERTKSDPVRFAALAEHMPDDLSADYFSAVLRGVGNRISQSKAERFPPISLEQVVQLVRRVHRLPNCPCGKWLAYLIEKWNGRDRLKVWPDDVLEAVAWYAINDPDPDKELWKTLATSDQYCYAGDPLQAGINSTRGSMAGAVATLLFDTPERFEQLKDAVFSLAHDRSVAVRACAGQPLLALLNFDASTAITWFKDSVELDPLLLETPYAARFVRLAAYRNYSDIRPILNALLSSQSENAVAIGAKVVCLVALDVEAAKADAEGVRTGTPVMRKAAAEVYSTNIAHQVVGAECQRLLKPLFADAEEAVRTEAASAFHQVSALSTEVQAELLSAFLEANPGPESLTPVVRALEDSPVQLPDLVCKLAEKSVEAFQSEGGDISKHGAMVAGNLSKIVIRLYTQTEDPVIQARCLTLMDDMELYHFFGLSDELQRLDR